MTFVQQLFKVVENDRTYIVEWGFLCGSEGKESACNAGDLGWEDILEKGKDIQSSILA